MSTREIGSRLTRRLPRLWGYDLFVGCTRIAACTVTMFALLSELRPDPWYHPRYALPLLGMILGNTMTGISLGLDALTNSLVRERAAIEACLPLGATRHQPLPPLIRSAFRTAFIPILNRIAPTPL